VTDEFGKSEADKAEAMAFAHQFRRFLDVIMKLVPRGDPSPLHDRLAQHLGRPPVGLPVVTEAFAPFEHANLQLGLHAYLATPGRSSELIGISGPGREHHGLTDIVEVSGRYGSFGLGAVDYTSVPVGPGRELTCVSFGVHLVDTGTDRLAALVRMGSPRTGDPRLLLEVLSHDAEVTRRFLVEVREQMARHNVFRGQVLTFEPHEFGHGVGPLRFHERPSVDAADVILPDGVLDRIHRQTAGVATHRARILAAGHHLKRGILLFGPPGTGKTHTVRHLMGLLPDATVVVLTGQGVEFVREACALARLVPPALIVLEDVDLIAEHRAMRPGVDPNPLLFQVLNEMDGVAGDADIVFVLTTNRADLVEPALTQRPGRVDLAVEVPLPGEAGRRRLLALYGANLRLTAEQTRETVAATAGMTGAYFAELARRAELLAATSGADGADGAERPTVDHVRTAIAELTESREALTAATPATPGRPPTGW
jgi:hypothetical protein